VRTLLLFSFLILFSCVRKEGDTTLFDSQKSLGTAGKKLSEASGLVASVSNPGYLWTHNDGGNPAEVYLINEKAEVVMTVKLKNIVNRDWEDITIGPGPEEGVSYLYVADIGDNNSVYPYKMLYRIKEPVFSGKKIEIDEINRLVIQLPGGPRDSESIMADPLTSDFYIISKRENSVRLYELGFPFVSDTLHAEMLGKLPFSDIVAADISPDGTEVLLKNYTSIYYWKRGENESIADLLQRSPVKVYYEPEIQGEAIAWKTDGTGFYTLSESGMLSEADLFFYKRKKADLHLPVNKVTGKSN